MAKTVLVVDDMVFVRKVLIEILTRGHYQIVGEATNGNEAVELYEKLRPNLVTMDIVMPQMSGLEAIKKIIKIDSEAKVVIISAMGQENLVMEAITVGARDFILKPFTSEEVLKTVERALMGEKNAKNRASAKPN
jgi:two-component system chemotaxis response regulator CheY